MPTIGTPKPAYYYDSGSDTLIPLASYSVVPGSGIGAAGNPMCVTFVADASANTTLTSQPAAEDYLVNSARHITKVDLVGYTQVRLVVKRMATASAAGAILTLKYSATDPATAFSAGAWTTSGASVSISTVNVTADSGWINMPAGMKANNLYLAVTQSGGDGTLSPVVGSVRAFFRGPTVGGIARGRVLNATTDVAGEVTTPHGLGANPSSVVVTPFSSSHLTDVIIVENTDATNFRCSFWGGGSPITSVFVSFNWIAML